MKKTTLIATVLVVALALSGCGIYTSAARSGVPKNPEGNRPNGTVSGLEVITPGSVDSAPVDPGPITPAPAKSADSSAMVRLTKAEAENIALMHAGVTAEQVKGLRSEYDFDDGVAHYDVEFRVGQWEYEYEIHAETGAVLSFEKDD